MAEAMMLAEPTILTPEGYERLEAELEEIRTVRRQEVADRLHAVLEEGGDLSENLAYENLKNEQAFLEGRVLELERILSNFEILDHDPPESPTIIMGSVVTVRQDGSRPETYRLVGPVEASPRDGRISNQSPLGRALLGKRVGEEVTIETPDGSMSFTIKTIK